MSYGDEYSKIKREAYLQGRINMLTEIKHEMENHKSKYGFYPKMEYFLKVIIPYWEKSLEKELEVQNDKD